MQTPDALPAIAPANTPQTSDAVAVVFLVVACFVIPAIVLGLVMLLKRERHGGDPRGPAEKSEAP